MLFCVLRKLTKKMHTKRAYGGQLIHIIKFIKDTSMFANYYASLMFVFV